MSDTTGVFTPDAEPLTAEHEAEIHRTLDALWRDSPGIVSWLRSVDHKSIATRYIATAFFFFLLGGVNALFIRMQLARPANTLLGPERYNQVFSMHGTTMMFLFAVPVMIALGLYLVPLMVGTRDVAFPRLNAFGYWTYLIGGLFLYVAFATGDGPNAGWFSYVPLAGSKYSPRHGIDVWAQTVTFTEIAALVAAVEILVTVLKQRAPGMSWTQLPIFVWSQVVTACMIVFAMPTIAVATMLLAADRAVQTQFFAPELGGDPLLWQHLFWFFGHPEVYIVFVPALGIVSEIVATFCGRRLVGHTAIVVSIVATGVLSFTLWAHHMFATPMPDAAAYLFTATSMLIAIPTGVQIMCWIATMWVSRPRFTVPMLFVCGFIATFVIGGLTGVMVAIVPFDRQVHDTFFVVAHLHYVLLGGGVFPLFAACYYWLPKITGRMPSERLAQWHFWLFFTGVNVTFFPQHMLGLNGMPRRIYTYMPETAWGTLNLVSTIGAVIIAASVVIFAATVIHAWRRGRHAGANPWGAHTLEWRIPSPPPSYGFLLVPVMPGAFGVWGGEGEGEGDIERSGAPAVTHGIRADAREILVTTAIDARLDHRQRHPPPSLWPLVMALAVGATFIGAVFTPWALVWGTGASLIALAGWTWPRRRDDSAESVALEDGTVREVAA